MEGHVAELIDIVQSSWEGFDPDLKLSHWTTKVSILVSNIRSQTSHVTNSNVSFFIRHNVFITTHTEIVICMQRFSRIDRIRPSGRL